MTSQPKPKIIVLAQSKAWCSVIRRTFDQANLCWVLSVDDLKAESEKLGVRAAIVEIPIANVDGLAQKLSLLTNNSTNLKIFAVGDSDLYHWRRLLQVAGIAMSCWSTLQADRLSQSVNLHLKASKTTSLQTLESIVESDLPWTTAANDPTA